MEYDCKYCAPSALSAVLLLIVTRINGVDGGAVFSISFATATILYAIADYGMRVYQVTDAERTYDFWTYAAARLIVDILMIVVAVIFVGLSGYDREKASVCLLIVGFRFVDGMSETFQGEFQLNGRLDISGKSVFYRMLLSVAGFLCADMITKNLVFSFVIMAIINAVVFLLYDVRLIKDYVKMPAHANMRHAMTIVRECFGTFASTILNLYIINVPKYAIDKWLGNAEQTYFNIIYLPTFTINLLSIFVLKPQLRSLGLLWTNREYKKFNSMVYKMLGLIAGITVVIMGVCYVVGIPLLSLIYGENLQGYRMELMILLVSGGFSAMTVMLFYTLTTMRCQNLAMVGYIIASAAGCILPWAMVKNMGILGAALSSVLIMLILFATLFIIYIVKKKSYTMTE